MRIYTTKNHYVVAPPRNIREECSDPEIFMGKGKVVWHGFRDGGPDEVYISDMDRFLPKEKAEKFNRIGLTEADAIEYLQTGKIKK